MRFKQKKGEAIPTNGIFPPLDLSCTFDVLVIGGGNAALCAAMTAREAGATVLLLESSPREFRGGNSRHTRNLRYLHESGNRHLTGPYLEDEFLNDLLSVTKGQTNEELARLVIRESRNIGKWMEQHGCRFQPAMRGTLLLDRTNAFFLGGGKALINSYYAFAERLGVYILYEATVQDLEINGGRLVSAVFDQRGVSFTTRARAVVLASGGYQADLEWLRDSWGPPADNFIIRGTPYNKGRLLRVMLDQGAKPIGDPRQGHGEEFWPKRYAIWGRLVAQQPDQIAFCIIDSKSLDLYIPSMFPPIEAASIREMADRLKLDPIGFEETINAFNAAARPGVFDPAALDSCTTEGLEVHKSHWARRLDTPPFYAYPLRPGITFTYLSLTVNRRAQVIMHDGRPAANIFAAGEIMSGNILGQGYLAGFGMTIGTVFGRIAGKESAGYVFGSPKRS
jgi:tricarballylate dehydrogenase